MIFCIAVHEGGGYVKEHDSMKLLLRTFDRCPFDRIFSSHRS